MATKGTKVPSIYKVPSKADPELKQFANSVKEALEVRLGRRGDPRDRAITLRELIDSGMAQELLDNPFDPNAGTGVTDFGGTTPYTDFTIPPTPTGFSVTASYTSFILAWDNPQMSNFGNTEVWRSTTSSLGDAIKVDTTSAFVWSEEVGYNKTYYYWVRHVSNAEVFGAYSSSGNGTTSIDIAAVMTNLSETLADLPGYSTLTSLISSSAGTAATVIKSSSAPTQRDGGDALTTNDIWYDTDDGQVYTRNAANNGWVAARDATLVNIVGSASYTGSSLTAALASAQGDIVTLTSENTARVSEITELEAITTGYSNSSTIAAAITSEATARANGDSANATSITNLTSTVDNKNQAFVQNNAPTAVATGDLWIDSNDNNKLYRWNGSSWVVVRDTANDGKTTVFTQASQPTANNTGDIWFDTNSSPANKQYRWDGSNWVEVRDVTSEAAITTEANTRATADTANATAITTLETNTNTALGTKASTASVTAVQNALTNGTSAQAGYGVAVNANGAVAGMYLMADSSGTLNNNTSTSNIIFEAGQVTIRNPHGNNIVPFTVLTSTDGAGNPAGVYIDTAFIKNASIAAAQIGSLSATLANAVAINASSISTGTLNADRVAANSIDIAGKSLANSIGTIGGQAYASLSLYVYSELYRPAFGSGNIDNNYPPHIASVTQTTGNDSGETGSIPAIYAGSTILGGSPLLSYTFTTYGYSGNRRHIIQCMGNVSGSSTAGHEELELAMVVRATSSSTNYTSTTLGDYVAYTAKSAGGSTIVLGAHQLAVQADLAPSTQYYVWVFGAIDDTGGSNKFYDVTVNVYGLNK